MVELKRWFLTPALTFYPLPQERKCLPNDFCFTGDFPANAAYECSRRRRKFHPLLGGEGRGEDGRFKQIPRPSDGGGCRRRVRAYLCFTLALILTFSPGEKEQPARGSVFVDGRPQGLGIIFDRNSQVRFHSRMLKKTVIKPTVHTLSVHAPPPTQCRLI
jgi:hypothetical protein